jgi:nucleoside-diphosphate-sugar epimerase
MPSTLLTGANSFFAAHLINQLVADGHSITGTVRSLSKGDQIVALRRTTCASSKCGNSLSLAVIQNGNFDYVIHNAAPVPTAGLKMDFDRDFLEPSVAG